jgi:uncharacterized membrane protein YagU involved in acid resistance
MGTTNHETQRNSSIWKGIAAGAVAGLAGSWTMNQFQSLIQNRPEEKEQPHGAQSAKKHNNPQQSSKAQKNDEDINPTEKVAEAVAENILDTKLTKEERRTGGSAVHYAFGTLTGAAYGTAAELFPKTSIGVGAPFGAAFWLAADEVAVPLMGLSKPPTEYPASTHVSSFASHIVFGVTAELVRRAVRRALH